MDAQRGAGFRARGETGARAFLTCVRVRVWARGSGFRAVARPPLPPPPAPPACLPPRRRAKGWGGATEPFSQQTRCVQKRAVGTGCTGRNPAEERHLTVS